MKNATDYNHSIKSVEEFFAFLNKKYNDDDQSQFACQKVLERHFSSLVYMKGTFGLPNTLYPQIGIKGDSLRYFFRGHEDSSYKLESSIVRNGDFHEHELFNFFETHAPTNFDSKSNFEKLALMQHYGCYTRLLDITENPLVALYFACQKSTDGEVIVFSPIMSMILQWNSDAVNFLAALPLLTQDEKNELTKLIIDGIIEYSSPFFEKFDDSRKTQIKAILEKTDFAIKEKFDFKEILFPRTVRAKTSFQRIKSQRGLFIIDPLKRGYDETAFVADKILIPRAYKKQILKELDCLGINDFTLFPDLEHFSKYANWKILKK